MNGLKQQSRNLSDSLKKESRYFLNLMRNNAKHLFLLSPPLSGSTAIAKLLQTSPHVAVFPKNGEGQFLPEAQSKLFVDQRWNPDFEVDWSGVKKIFFKYWSPLKPIRFEKTPPQVVRALELEQVFNKSYFLVTIRNPYAQIEGLLRRQWPFGEYGPQTSSAPPASPKMAAEFWVRVAKHQKYNLEKLQKTCFFSYEELTETPNQVVEKVLQFLPEISTLDTQAKLHAHNITGESITGLKNLNQEKIDRLTLEQIQDINEVLSQNIEILSFFKYSMIDVD